MNRRYRISLSFSWPSAVAVGVLAMPAFFAGCGGEPAKQATIQPEPIHSDAPLPDPKDEPVLPPGGP